MENCGGKKYSISVELNAIKAEALRTEITGTVCRLTGPVRR